jgi:hypothetical protein
MSTNGWRGRMAWPMAWKEVRAQSGDAHVPLSEAARRHLFTARAGQGVGCQMHA